MNALPGRACPLDYRYGAAAVAGAPTFEAETLYVVGGLYGNLAALDEIERMAADEAGPVTILFNGDFNWFNVGNAGFAEINRRVLAHRATAGNVEAELVRADAEAGCGCAYPASVDQATVERSNAIHARLCETALRHPGILARLAALPRLGRCRVGRATVGIVHGDAESLAGWDFDIAALDRHGVADALAAQFHAAAVDVFACSHTCLPVFRQVPSRHGPGLIANTGAAGMPNFRGARHGVITRVSQHPSPTRPLYGTRVADANVDALAVRYDHARFAAEFVADWPAGSPAHLSYWQRIADGPQHDIECAAPRLAGAFAGAACAST